MPSAMADGTTTLTVDGETVDLNRNVQVGSDAGTTTAEYSNVYSNLTVSKLWLEPDTHQPVEPAAENIQIRVWRTPTTQSAKTLFREATLNADNDWTCSGPARNCP